MGLPATLSGLCTLVVVLVFFPLPSLGSIASHSNALQVSDNNEGISIAGHAPWQLRAWLATQLDLGPCDLILLCLSVYRPIPSPCLWHSTPSVSHHPAAMQPLISKPIRIVVVVVVLIAVVAGRNPNCPIHYRVSSMRSACGTLSLSLSLSLSPRTTLAPPPIFKVVARECVCPFGTSVRAVFSPVEQYEQNGDTRYDNGIVAHNQSSFLWCRYVGRWGAVLCGLPPELWMVSLPLRNNNNLCLVLCTTTYCSGPFRCSGSTAVAGTTDLSRPPSLKFPFWAGFPQFRFACVLNRRLVQKKNKK